MRSVTFLFELVELIGFVCVRYLLDFVEYISIVFVAG